jgi:hypothetical protein
MIRIEDVHVFHEYLRSIANSGVPVDLGMGDSAHQLSTHLMDISSRLSRASSQGITIETALRNDPDIPPEYREAILYWETHRNLPNALVGLVGLGQHRRETIARFSASFIQPVILVLLVYVGVWHMLHTLIPSMEAIYNQMREPAGRWLSFWMELRQREWLWLAGVPLFLFIALLAWNYGRKRWNSRWMPDRVIRPDLHEKIHQTQILVHSLQRKHDSSSEQSKSELEAINPLQRWALTISTRPEDQIDALRFVEKLYRDSTRYHALRWNEWIPTIVATALGGGLILCFALGVFTPMIELLYRLVQPQRA